MNSNDSPRNALTRASEKRKARMAEYVAIVGPKVQHDRPRMTLGGNGSHWDGCHLVHRDCASKRQGGGE
jgi:hypothetical protein